MIRQFAYNVYENYLNRQIEKEQMPEHIIFNLFTNGQGKSSEYLLDTKSKQVLGWCQGEFNIKHITIALDRSSTLDYETMKGKLEKLKDDSAIHNYGRKIKFIGPKEQLPKNIRNLCGEIEEMTGYHTNFLNIGLSNYSGREEIIKAIKQLAQKAREGMIDPGKIDESTIGSHLYMPDQPDPDLIFRTDSRISGDLFLWQRAYSEFVFLDIYWDGFRKIDLMRGIRTYQQRQRRFGR